MPYRPPVHSPYRGNPDDRLSAARRGYDRDWRALRDAFLRHNPFCADCRAAGRITPASEAHHIRKVRDHPELRLDGANLRPLCHRCHSARTLLGE